MDSRWAAGWRAEVVATVAGLMDTFQARFGYEPGVSRLGPLADQEALAQLLRLVPRPADDVIDFHRYVGEASLPEIGNGYFVHASGPLAGPGPMDMAGRKAAGRLRDLAQVSSNT